MFIVHSIPIRDGKFISQVAPSVGTIILASAPFFLSMAFTPGPNNIMLASSGVNFGFRATIPHIAGITVGFPLLLVLVGLGLAQMFMAVPLIHTVFKALSIGYLVYLAWRIATAAQVTSDGGRPRPLSFLQAAAFQWVNVKAWIIALSAATTYTVVDSSLPLQIGGMALLNSFITLASASTWTVFGHFLRDYLPTDTRRRWFNYGMAALLLISIVPTFSQ